MIQLKRGTTDYWSNQNPVLSDGQAAVVRTVHDTMTNTYNARLKIGDGKTAYNDLEFAVPDIAIYADNYFQVPSNRDFKICIRGAHDGYINTTDNRLRLLRNIGGSTSAILDSGYCFVKLFEGNFGPNSGTVNIPGISNYSLFSIRASNRYSCFIASLQDTYIRGISGYCSGSNIWVNTLGLTIDPATDNVTYVASGAAYVNITSAKVSTDQINDTIAEIYGILPKSEQAL